MTRGRPPQKALDDALLIAKARGDLLVFKDKPAFECDYMFLSADRFCIVGSNGPGTFGAHRKIWKRSASKRSKSSGIFIRRLFFRARSGSAPKMASSVSSGSKVTALWSLTGTERSLPLLNRNRLKENKIHHNRHQREVGDHRRYLGFPQILPFGYHRFTDGILRRWDYLKTVVHGENKS